MTVDVKAESAAAKQRIKNKTNDNRDLTIVALLDATGTALLGNTELYKKNLRLQEELKAIHVQVRDLTRNNDMLETRMARHAAAPVEKI